MENLQVAQQIDHNSKETMGKVGQTPPVIPVRLKYYTQSFTAFIGGAADKYPFLYRDSDMLGGSLGPTDIVGSYAKNFDSFSEKNETIYYGYEEAYSNRRITLPNKKKSDAFKDILEKIKINPRTQVNIVGHSLGGWNAAGLVQELNLVGVEVNLLITIDPVGIILSKVMVPEVGLLWMTPTTRAQIYLREPRPKANKWINIFCNPEKNIGKDMRSIITNRDYHPTPQSYQFDDLVADTGGQWLTYPKHNAFSFHETKFSHAYFTSMMQERIPALSLSPELALKRELMKVKI